MRLRLILIAVMFFLGSAARLAIGPPEAHAQQSATTGEKSPSEVKRQQFAVVRREFWKEEARRIEAERQAGLVGRAVREADVYPLTVTYRTSVGTMITEDNLDRMKRGLAPKTMEGASFQLHHKVPISQGGTNDFDNLVPVNPRIHQKWSKLMHDPETADNFKDDRRAQAGYDREASRQKQDARRDDARERRRESQITQKKKKKS